MAIAGSAAREAAHAARSMRVSASRRQHFEVTQAIRFTARAERTLLVFLSSAFLLFTCAVAAPLNDGAWPMATGDFANTRYSALEQITPANVATLRPAFQFPIGVERGQEAAPIVVGDTMYVVAPFPNYLYALDLSKPGANLKWRFDPKGDPSARGVACCDHVNRGAAYADGRRRGYTWLSTKHGLTRSWVTSSMTSVP